MKTPTQSSDLNGLISSRGAGGEIHQNADGTPERLTTAQGVVIADNQNSLRFGAPGPTLLEDFALREKIFHIDHERIPERVVHARAMARMDLYLHPRHGRRDPRRALRGSWQAD